MSDPTRGSGGDEYGEFRGLLEQAEQHAEAASTATRARPDAAATAVTQVCQFWPTLRTVLQIALKLPFISPKVKNVIRNAIPVFEAICGNS
jgi:hypothetical protein